MNKLLVLLGTSALMLGTIASSAQARLAHYEINGKRYSYSTQNRAQSSEARKRIEAAKAVQAAKAKADAEKKSYPLVAAFGSKTQRELAEAQSRLDKLMGTKSEDSNQEADVKTLSKERYVARSGRSDRAHEPRVREAAAEEPAPPAPPAPPAEPPRPMKVAMPMPAVAEPLIQNRVKKVRSVSFDVESGIKTTLMIDGSIEEEPFDTSVLRQLAPEQGEGNSLTAFVNQLRRLSPEETTGSIRTKATPPDSQAASALPVMPRP